MTYWREVDEPTLPCPFCGAAPQIAMIGNEHTRSRKAEIRCSGCLFKAVTGAIRQNHAWCREQVIAKWNARAYAKVNPQEPDPTSGGQQTFLPADPDSPPPSGPETPLSAGKEGGL